MIRTTLALVLALAAAGCATRRPPPADRIVYVTEYIEIDPASAPRSAWSEAPRTPPRDDVPESVRRDWYANNGPVRYAPAYDEPQVEVQERCVHEHHDCGGCGGYGGLLGLPISLSLGYFGGSGHGHGHGHGHGGWSYGIGLGSGFGCW